MEAQEQQGKTGMDWNFTGIVENNNNPPGLTGGSGGGSDQTNWWGGEGNGVPSKGAALHCTAVSKSLNSAGGSISGGRVLAGG